MRAILVLPVLLVLLVLFLISSALGAITRTMPLKQEGPANEKPTCIAPREGWEYTITDATSTAGCTTSGGSTKAPCICRSSTWTPISTAIGAGTGSSTPSFDAAETDTLNAASCEFTSGLCSSWTWHDQSSGATNEPSSGTVSPTSTSTTTIYDTSTWPGWVLWQSDETVASHTVLRRAVTLSTNATVFVHMLWPNSAGGSSIYANNELQVGFRLCASGSANQCQDDEVKIGIDTDGGSINEYQVDIVLRNGGSISQIEIPNFPNVYSADGYYFVIWKASNVYHFGMFTAGGGYMYFGNFTKTGTTTLDRLEVAFYTGAVSPRMIAGVDFVRVYDTVNFGLLNQ